MERADPEYESLFQIFREECREHIHNLNEGLLRLERQPEEAPLDEILRSAHSLKGASRMMGFKTIETLAHHLETLLTQVIRGDKQATPAVTEALYRAVDAVSRALGSLEEGKEPDAVEELLEQIRMAVEEKDPSAATTKKQLSQIKPKPGPSREVPPRPIRMENDGALATIRVQTEKLDALINQTGELLVSKIEAIDNLRQMEKTLDLFEEWRRGRTPTQGSLLSRIDALSEELYNIVLRHSDNTHRLERLIDDIHLGVSDLRLLPLSTILEPFPRMVRDLSRDLGKEVDLTVEGASTRFDKKILEELREPLIHLVRNSVDHGIESPQEREEKGKPRQGKIVITARHEGGKVLISLADDGKGLDRRSIERTAVQKGIALAEEIARWQDEEVWELIFRNGFSTSDQITEVSGRGVGLDAVRTKVENLKGSLIIESRPGEAVAFTVSLPLTLSTIHALIFQAGSQTFCLPTDWLENTLLLSPQQISPIEGKPTAIINGSPLAFAWLADLLKLPRLDNRESIIPAILLHTPRGRAVLAVEALIGEEEIVAKDLGKLLKGLPHLSGGTILGKGEIALILNPIELVRSLSHQSGAQATTAASTSRPLPATKKKVLVADDSLTTRVLEKNILEAGGFEVTLAVDGEDALNKLHEKSFDVVITDVQMPRLDGFTLTQRVKKNDRFKEIPVILVTSLQSDEDKKKGIESGADAYITKSTFDQKNLLEIIQRFV